VPLWQKEIMPRRLKGTKNFLFNPKYDSLFFGKGKPFPYRNFINVGERLASPELKSLKNNMV